MTTTLKLHHFALSGHSHRAQLMLSLLGLPHEVIPVKLREGEHKTEAFLKFNPFGQVPVLEDGDTVLFDSNAILVYLARRYDPRRPLAAAGRGRPGVGAGLAVGGCRPDRLRPGSGPHDHIVRFQAECRGSHRPLPPPAEGDGDRVGPARLPRRPRRHAGRRGRYSYIAAAPEGNVDLAAYPNLRAWLARIEALPGFVPFPKSAVGLRA